MRLIIVALLLLSGLVADTKINADYAITFGIFGEIGTAKAQYETKGGHYFISLEANSAGIAKFFSSNRKERYTSRGIIQEGRLVPEVFTKLVYNNNKSDYSEYYFDHEERNVTRYRKRHKINEEGEEVEVKTEEKPARYYARDDLLSLYFNLSEWMKTMRAGEKRVEHAMGANREDGRVDIVRPDGKDLDAIRQLLEVDDGKFLTVAINQKIFASENGELHLRLDEDYLCSKAVLKDVIFFGDIVGTMTNKRVR